MWLVQIGCVSNVITSYAVKGGIDCVSNVITSYAVKGGGNLGRNVCALW